MFSYPTQVLAGMFTNVISWYFNTACFIYIKLFSSHKQQQQQQQRYLKQC